MTESDRFSRDVDLDRANGARMYDYLLGGAHNFAVDRAQVEKVLSVRPDFVVVARANRAYLARVVRRCLQEGFEQFLDLGSGVPTAGNVHEIAHALAPGVRVAYVDIEPVAVAHAETLVHGLDTVSVTHADLREPHAVLQAPGVARLLDLSRPVALLAIGVLHFVPGDLGPLMAGYREALAPGSAVAVSHVSDDVDDPVLADRVRAGVAGYRGSASEGTIRSRDDIHRLLSGTRLLAPGLVDVVDWPRPTGADPVGLYGAVGLSPGGDADPS